MRVQNFWPLKKNEVYFLHKCPWALAASPLQWKVKFQHGIKGKNVLPLVYSHVDWAGQISPLSRRHQGARGWLQVDSQAVCHRPSSQQHANLPPPRCRLSSIQEWFTGLWILSCILEREPWLTFPLMWQSPLEGSRIVSKIPSGFSGAAGFETQLTRSMADLPVISDIQ